MGALIKYSYWLLLFYSNVDVLMTDDKIKELVIEMGSEIKQNNKHTFHFVPPPRRLFGRKIKYVNNIYFFLLAFQGL